MNTDRMSVVATAVYDRIKSKMGDLGLNDVLYGDHREVAKDKTVVVTPRVRRRILDGVAGPGGRTRNEFDIEINVYLSKVADEATQRLAVERLAEAVEQTLYTDITLGGVIIHGFVSSFDEGNVQFVVGGSMFRAVRMQYFAITKTNIGP